MSAISREAPCFVDTNILVYAAGGTDARRSPIAQELLKRLMQSQSLRTSVQVLQELYVTLTRKMREPFTVDAALRYLDWIASWPVIGTNYAEVRDAIDLSQRAIVSYWDALIVVTAARSGAKTLYTEDLQHGQKILGVEVVNPFFVAPTPTL